MLVHLSNVLCIFDCTQEDLVLNQTARVEFSLSNPAGTIHDTLKIASTNGDLFSSPLLLYKDPNLQTQVL